MSNFTAACVAKLTEDQKQDLRWRMYWIAGREYYRANSPDSMAGYDEIATKSYPSYEFDSGDSVLNDYLQKLGAGIKSWLPGWDDTACSFDQQEFACFCSWLAWEDEAERAKALSKMASGSSPGDITCDEEVVKKDPIYNTNFPGIKIGKKKIWPWILGIGIIGAVGAVVYSEHRKHRK